MARKTPKFQLTPDQQYLAEKNMNLARREAWRFQRSTGIEYQIMESVAFEGLCQAAAKYDPMIINENTGTSMKFSSLAVPYIRGAILHYIRDKTYAMRLSHKMRENWIKGRKLLHQGANDIEIAEALGIDLETWQETRSVCSGPPLELKDQSTPTEPLEPDEVDVAIDYRELAAEMISRLPEADMKILRNYYTGTTSRPPTRQVNALFETEGEIDF
jgi:DNA-directed RNA polymerase specialized sigma subunit